MKRRTFTRDTLTLDPDLPTHCFNQTARDVETQTRTTYRTIDIALQAYETLEQADPDPVAAIPLPLSEMLITTHGSF